MTKTIKVKKDRKTQECYLDIKDFKDSFDISKIESYTLESSNNDGYQVLILKFYDKDGNIIKPK